MTTEMKHTPTPHGVTQDYETMHHWLCQNGWQCMWQEKGPRDTAIKYNALYIAPNGAQILTQQYKESGWHYFIGTQTHKITDSLTEIAALKEGRACNAHEELVAALELAERKLLNLLVPHISEDMKTIRAVLAKARGEASHG